VFVTGFSRDGFFIEKFNSSGGNPWGRMSSNLGMGPNEAGYDIALDDLGGVYVTGYTNTWGWVSGGLDDVYDAGLSDGFVIRFNSTGGEAVWSTYLGGSGTDYGRGIAVDGKGSIYATGWTSSSGWVNGTNAATGRKDDGFLVKITEDSIVVDNRVLYETFARGVAYSTNLSLYQSALLSAGYTVERIFDDVETGFHAVALRSQSNLAPAVLAIRGTDFSDFTGDWYSNLTPGSVGLTQFEANWMKPGPDNDIYDWLEAQKVPASIVGHSLGGALTQLVASSYTALGKQLSDVITFNSPGISLAQAEQFKAGQVRSVTHHVVNGDVVSMAGEAFIAGDYKLYAYDTVGNEANPATIILEKHGTPVLEDVPVEVNGELKINAKAAGVTVEAFNTETDGFFGLNSKWFFYTDVEYYQMLGVLTIGASLVNLGTVPSALIFRGTTEEARREIGVLVHKVGNQARTLATGAIEIGLADKQIELKGGLVKVNLSGMKLRFDAQPSAKVTIRGAGSVSIKGMPTLGADFAGDNFISLGGQDGFHMVGQISLSDWRPFPGAWELRHLKINVNTVDSIYGGSVRLLVPGQAEVEGAIQFKGSSFDAIRLEGDKLNTRLWPTLIYLQSILGGAYDLAPGDPAPRVFGKMGVTGGPKITFKAPWFGGIYSLELVNGIVTGEVTDQSLMGVGQVYLIGGIVSAQGKAMLDWDSGNLKVAGNVIIMGGLASGQMTLYADRNLNVHAQATASIQFPDVDMGFALDPIYDWVRGSALKGNTRLEFSNDGNMSNDYVAGWTTISVPKVGDLPIGLMVWLDGDIDMIWRQSSLRRINAPSGLSIQVGMAAAAQSVRSQGFEVSGEMPFALFSVDWAAGVMPTGIEIVAPDGTVYGEADFASQVKVAQVDALTRTGKRTLSVINPTAGIWTVRVTDDGSHGLIGLEGLAGSMPTSVAVTDTQNQAGGVFDVAYKVSNPGVNAKVALYYDADGKGYDGVLIASDLAVGADGTGKFTWDAGDVPAGAYKVYATVIGENDAPVDSAYSAASFSVNQFVLGAGGAKSITYTDADGTTATVTLSAGTGTLDFEGEGIKQTVSKTGAVTLTGTNVRLANIDITGSTAKGQLAFGLKNAAKTSDGQVSIGGVHVDGPIAGIVGAGVNLTGDLVVAGAIKTLTMGDVGGAAQQIVSLGGSGADKTAVTFGRVSDVTFNASGGLASFKAVDWRDTDGMEDELKAVSLGGLSVTGKTGSKVVAAIAGDFEADVVLTGAGIDPAKVGTLGAVSIAGRVSGAWEVTGKAAAVTVGAMEEAQIKVTGELASFTSKGTVEGDSTLWVGGAGGAISSVNWLGGWINVGKAASITTKGLAATKSVAGIAGDFTAGLTVTGAGVKAGLVRLGPVTVSGAISGAVWSVAGKAGAITAGSLTGVEIDVAGELAGVTSKGAVSGAVVNVTGALGAVMAVNWLGGSIRAGKVGSIAVKGLAASKGILAVAGDFAGKVNITGAGASAKTAVLGSVSIAGGMNASNWVVEGKAGAISVGGANGSSISVNGDLASFTSKGGLMDTDLLSQGAIGAVTSVNWLGGSITADKVASITTKGQAATKLVGAVAGDFTGGVHVTGEGVAATALSLGTVSIAGALREASWQVGGKAGAVTVGSAVGVGIEVAGDLASFTSKGQVQESWLTSEKAIGAVTSLNWLGGAIEADKVGAISTKGLAAGKGVAGVAGDFSGNVSISGEGVGAKVNALGSASIAGTLVNSVWRIMGNSGVVTLGAAAESAVFVGVSGGVDGAGLPVNKAGFALPSAALAGFVVTGKGVGNMNTMPSFVNTRVAAGLVGNVSLKRVDVDEAMGNGFVTAGKIGSYSRQTGALATNVIKVSSKTAAGVYDSAGGYRLAIVG
jgi:hypothetical protein